MKRKITVEIPDGDYCTGCKFLRSVGIHSEKPAYICFVYAQPLIRKYELCNEVNDEFADVITISKCVSCLEAENIDINKSLVD